MERQMTAGAPPELEVRFVEYVDPDVRAALPAAVPATWIAEDSCARATEYARGLDPAAAEVLAAHARSFLDDALSVVREDWLPACPEECLYVDFADRLQLVGARIGWKIRVDEDLNVALVREKPLAFEGARAGSIRRELAEVLAFPLMGADGKPVEMLKVRDFSGETGVKDAFYISLDAPAGLGYAGGRFDRLDAYGDGKVLLFGFHPIEADGAAEEAEAAARARPRKAGPRPATLDPAPGMPAVPDLPPEGEEEEEQVSNAETRG